ncbi:c-type cytochrome [Cesiribacter andamanensis]|uniref:Cytochrome c552 n=1 Tax=Cesiribacter andamanensis AMV16 TaxID=1279009 RepID=M7N8F1_9BACT|nr:cytochrome c [Cesiribacter andamanensis]EMR03491.1 Cytochrome c552 [Cesiribacter andamanensis AMV16]
MSTLHHLGIGLLLLLCLITMGCSGKEGREEQRASGPNLPEGIGRSEEQRFRQYWVQGRILYKQHCMGCHQNDGAGMAQLIPPLDGADFLQNKQAVICVIRHGMQGTVVVNGREYSGIMPPNPQLRPLEIAEIATYILNTWTNQEGYVGIPEVEAALQGCQP